MKAKIYFLLALIVLALFFCLGSAGGYEAGKLSTPELLTCCSGSVATMWASLVAIDKIERGKEGRE